MALKCKRTGKSLYPMDQPVRINDDLVYSKEGFTCAASGAKLTLNNYIVFEGDVYHKNHVPKIVPDGSAGLSMSVAHAMASQNTSSSAKVHDKSYTGDETSGFAAIPDHISKAKENGSGFSGARQI
mmetsp:Transcript_13791/g.35439  ORF Transcript_13791/g.35439 Transcript_13791/m.35439 type:complete len:126 (-) Transcript_13791:164-541(-)